MPVRDDFREINEKKVLSAMMDVNELTKLQQRFTAVSNIFTVALSGQGHQITEMSGHKEQSERLRKSLGAEVLLAAYKRVLDNPLEDMVVEDTQYENVKIGAIAIRGNNKMLVCWLLVAVISDTNHQMKGLGNLDGFSMKTTYSAFLKSMDLLQYMASSMLHSQSMIAAAETEKTRIRQSEEKVKKTVARTDMITKFVQFLERTDPIETVLEDMLTLVGEYLGVESAHVFRLEGNRKMDVICEWYQSDIMPYFEKKQDIDKLSILRGDKTAVILRNAKLSIEDQSSMDICGATAVICAPIVVQKVPDLYVLFVSQTPKTVWNTEDIRLVNDGIKIVQSIMVRKIQKNSLAISYASLEAILDNVGSAVFVRNAEWNSMLFVNQMTKKYFGKELKEGRLMDLIRNPQNPPEESEKEFGQYEVTDRDKNKWYEVTTTEIPWVDGSQVELYAVYDITEKKEYQKQIEKQAFTDFLTGLNNRLCCERDLTEFLEECAKNPENKGAVVYIDLDNFKQVNDNLGHEYGDVLLKSVANGFKAVKGIEETCYRIGGDEFIVLIPSAVFEEKERIAEELLAIFKKPFILKNEDYYCTMSMGMVSYPVYGKDMQELLKYADIAMYKAKKAGKNRMAVYEPGDEMKVDENDKKKPRS